MNKPRENAEVIKAWADGKTIQFDTGSGWEDLEYATNGPWTRLHNVEWRIKPEKVKAWVNVYSDYGMKIRMHKTRNEADHSASKERIACVEIEYEEGQGL